MFGPVIELGLTSEQLEALSTLVLCAFTVAFMVDSLICRAKLRRLQDPERQEQV